MSGLPPKTIWEHIVASWEGVKQFFLYLGSWIAHKWAVFWEAVSWFFYQVWLWMWFILQVVLWLFVGLCVFGLVLKLIGWWRKRRSAERATNITFRSHAGEGQPLLHPIPTFVGDYLERRQERRREQERKARVVRAEADCLAQEELRAKQRREEEDAQSARMAHEAEQRRIAEAARHAREMRDAADQAEQYRKQYQEWKEQSDRVFQAQRGNLSYPSGWPQSPTDGPLSSNDVFMARYRYMKRLFESTGNYTNTLKEERNRWHPNSPAISVLARRDADRGKIIEMVNEMAKVIGRLYELECGKTGQAER
jgi:hypothetical protein